MKRLFALLLALGLAACSTVSPIGGQDSDKFGDFLNRIQEITLADIDVALADVHAHGDVDLAALQCYPALAEFIRTSPIAPSTPNIKGVLSANQIKRDVLLGGVTQSGPFQMALRKLHTACAAYVMDERRFAVEFAVMVGAASRGVPLPPIAVGPVVPIR